MIPPPSRFLDRGDSLVASDAVIGMVRCMPRLWRWSAFLRVVPRPLRDAAYRPLARHRYRLPGTRATCMVPPPTARARLVDEIPRGEP